MPPKTAHNGVKSAAHKNSLTHFIRVSRLPIRPTKLSKFLWATEV
jgi:hypothetical protein